MSKTPIECTCSSDRDICDIGEYCTMEDAPNSCSLFTPAPTGSPLDPTFSPTRTPTTASPTAAPTIQTCNDFVYWSEETASFVCSEGTWGSTDKGFETMMACDETLQTRLQDSYINKLFKNCNSWCIYDLEDPVTLGWIWKVAPQSC